MLIASALATAGYASTAIDHPLHGDRINTLYSAYASVSQTVTDASDPISFASELASTTPTLIQLVVGDGANDGGRTALTDQVNPVSTSLPLVGGQPLADIMGLPKVSTAQGSGVVRFIEGGHGSLISPSPSTAALAEMQSQAISFIISGGANIVVTDTSVIEN